MKKVVYTICLVAILLIAGCAGPADKKISVEPRPEPVKGLYYH